jgi:hypothetical protein
MRHANVLALFCCISIAGCSSTRPYASTATDVFRSSHGWLPAASSNPQLSAAEEQRLSSDIATCTNELAERLARVNETPPRFRLSRVERVLQLVTCMDVKGWRLIREEIVITSGA